MDPAKVDVAALVFGGLAGFAGIKMVLAGRTDHKLAAAGFSYSFSRAFVGFNFRHISLNDAEPYAE